VVDEGDVGAGGGGDEAAQHSREHRNGTWGRPEQVQQAKEAMVTEVFQDLVDDLLREVVFDMHRHVHPLPAAWHCTLRLKFVVTAHAHAHAHAPPHARNSKAKMGLMCFNCEDQYPSGILDKNGYDVFGQAVSGKVVTGEVRFDCLNCGRTVVRSLPPPMPSPTRFH
jgi:hypothetical protein